MDALFELLNNIFTLGRLDVSNVHRNAMAALLRSLSTRLALLNSNCLILRLSVTSIRPLPSSYQLNLFVPRVRTSTWFDPNPLRASIDPSLYGIDLTV